MASIDDVRRALLEQGISPRVCMKGGHEVRQLTIGKCCIHTVPENLASIQTFRKNLSQRGIKMDYYGEGLPAISNKALTALLRYGNQRRYLEDEEKAELMKQQDFKCGICGDPLSFRNTEFYHIAPLCATIGEQVFSAVHQHCHSRKTAEEERPLDDDPLTVSLVG